MTYYYYLNSLLATEHVAKGFSPEERANNIKTYFNHAETERMVHPRLCTGLLNCDRMPLANRNFYIYKQSVVS